MITDLTDIGIKAKQSAKILASAVPHIKTKALYTISDSIIKNEKEILQANKLDMDNSIKNGLSPAMQDRLLLTSDRIKNIAQSVIDIAKLTDPVGKILSGSTIENGLEIIKKTVPLGVIGIIYESRPNVTVDCGVLCLKSGNSCILRGGSEAINSNKALANIMRSAIEKSGLPIDCIQLIQDTSRETATQLMGLNKYVDLLIPRGGKGLIQTVVKNATVPVIETGAGNCHIFVDESADVQMAVDIIDNSKTSRPSVCNAVETVLIHENIAEIILPKIKLSLDKSNVEIRGCKNTVNILGNDISTATEQDWDTEFGDFTVAIKVVKNITEAISHIEKYSTHHSESIITKDFNNSQTFTEQVDSAAVYVNSSTRFTDGGVFGLGAEIGISTQKLHARGPMGLEALTSTKYIIRGNGQIR